jgi:hypothetical protein
MTKIIITWLTLAGVLALASCTTVKDPAVHTTSTTTESTIQPQPVPATTETQTVRSY